MNPAEQTPPEQSPREPTRPERDPQIRQTQQSTAGTEIGALIGAGFGLLFLIINSSQFSSLGRTLVLALGVIAFLGVVVFAVRGLMHQRSHETPRAAAGSPGTAQHCDASHPGAGKRDRRQPPFGRGYWIIVVIEAIALFAGSRMLAGLDHPELGVAWVAFVVGTHFYALGWVFALDRFHVLATIVTLCGIGGFIAYFAAAPAFIPVISGIFSGFVLLGFGIWALIPTDPR